jgi:hypothetical protein
VYRFYNGIVSTNNICETIAPTSPTVTDQWNATAGKIQIFTTVKTLNETEQHRISGYNHNIVFQEYHFRKKTTEPKYMKLFLLIM